VESIDLLNSLLTLLVIEMNLAENAEAFKTGQHPGYVGSAWEGLRESIDVIAERGIKVVINGGGLNPSGLAAKVSKLVRFMNDPRFLADVPSPESEAMS
jgi:hypothetical protein